MTLNSLTLNGKTYDKFPADRTRGLILPAEITGSAASTISVPVSLISIPLSGYKPSIGDMVLTLDNCLYKITGFTVGEETEYTGKLIRTLSSGSSQNVELDTTLTQSGKAADAKVVGDALSELENKIPENADGVSDYTGLTNKPKINGVEVSGDKTSADYGIGNPTNEQIASAVEDYMAEHPNEVPDTYTKNEIDAIMGSYITDIDTLVGGDS